jgi:hypothetical protein
MRREKMEAKLPCTIAVLLLAWSGVAGAQRADPAGVTVSRVAANARVTPARPSARVGITPSRSTVADSGDKRHGGIWTWVAVGALGGAVVGGAVLAAHVARTDDAFFAGPAIGFGIAVGTVGGGVIGAIAFGVTHASHVQSAMLGERTTSQ